LGKRFGNIAKMHTLFRERKVGNFKRPLLVQPLQARLQNSKVLQQLKLTKVSGDIPTFEPFLQVSHLKPSILDYRRALYFSLNIRMNHF